jgi:predicted CXXCH cytochrome family protein
LYDSSTYHQDPNSPQGVANRQNLAANQLNLKKRPSVRKAQSGNVRSILSGDSSLCLSCHDGTVAPGQTVAYGKIPMSGGWKTGDNLGTNLQGSHPFSLPQKIQDSPDLVASLASSGTTTDVTGSVKLIKGNIECTSCHNPHVQNIDKTSLNFLVMDSSKGQMCLACHAPDARTVSNQNNYLAGWTSSIHATVNNAVINQGQNYYVGGYGTVAQNACVSCHAPHNAPLNAQLIRSQIPPPQNAAEEDSCRNCHSGGPNVSAPNVFAEFGLTSQSGTPPAGNGIKVGHPFPSQTNPHDAAESVLLNNDRHSTCADCHNPHAANQVTIFPNSPAIRVSQTGVVGIALDGQTVLAPAVNQYENCLRCHGSSTGKAANAIYGYLPSRVAAAGDPLNVIFEFSPAATSRHPVMFPRNSPYPQPSLLSTMTNIQGTMMSGQSARNTSSQILCSDCHNSDDNREFGGIGPNGPHGSKWLHILERRYEFSQAPAPGQNIINLFPNPDISVAGPYAMCAKCHDMNSILSNASFSEHARHINDGFSCSACHTAHGVGAPSGNISGERLINFDVNVVAQNGSTPISYNRTTNSCSLTCHTHQHSNGNLSSIKNRIRVRGK